MNSKRLVLVTGLVSWAFLGGLGLPWAHAGVMFSIFDTTGGEWKVSTTDPRVTSFKVTNVMTGPPPLTRTTVVQLFETWDNANALKPISVNFFQNFTDGNVGGGNSAAGLNFLLRKTVEANNTGIPWSAFTETLRDNDLPINVPPMFVGRKHPSFAHFHADNNKVFDPATWNLTGADPGQSVTVNGQPPVPGNGGKLDFQVQVHDILVMGFQRQFVLTEQPIGVPEPATISLLGIGTATLIGYAWRRRRKASLRKGW
jgi:hypothetical protein